MKRIMFILLMILLTTITLGVMVETGDRIYLDCVHNATGQLTGTGATNVSLDCWDQDGNADVSSGAGLYSGTVGIYYYVFAETDDRYFCKIDCPGSGIDYAIPVLQGSVSDIDDILTDTGTTLDGIVDDILVDTGTTLDTIVDSILEDTSAQDTSTELRTLLTGSDTAVSTLTTSSNIGINWGDVSNGGSTVALGSTTIGICTDITNPVDLNSTLLTSLTNIEEDTNELQADDVPGLISALNDDIAANLSVIDDNVDDIETDTNELQSDDIPGTLSSMDSKLDTIDNYIDTEVATILAAIEGNLSQIFSDTAAILVDTSTTLDNYIDTEIAQMLQAIIGNTTAWANVATGFASLENATAIRGDLTTAQTDLDNPAQYKATGFSSLENATSIKSDIFSLNDITVAEIWAGVMNQSGKSANLTIGDMWYIMITAQDGMNANFSATGASGLTLDQIDARLNKSHSEGNWTGQGVALTSDNIDDIALGMLNYTVNCTAYKADSLGCTVWADERYNR